MNEPWSCRGSGPDESGKGVGWEDMTGDGSC